MTTLHYNDYLSQNKLFYYVSFVFSEQKRRNHRFVVANLLFFVDLPLLHVAYGREGGSLKFYCFLINKKSTTKVF